MSVATSTLRQISHSPQPKQSPSQIEVDNKTDMEQMNGKSNDSQTCHQNNADSAGKSASRDSSSRSENNYMSTNQCEVPSTVNQSASTLQSYNGYQMYNNYANGMTSQYQLTNSNASNGNISQNAVDPIAPLPNEIFELLNEFWRPNDVAMSENQNIPNGKVNPSSSTSGTSRRSPEGSLDETIDEEKETEDDLTSLGENDISVDRTTQKRRYSRLSDGYERLKSVLPSVKDKRRVSKARILDEAINYIQRLESITNVLKREHEKRLNVLNGSSTFFPDYSMQPYMRSLFQKQMYPQSLSASKMNQYPKMTASMVAKSPRMKQYNQYPQSQTAMGPSTMTGATDYNYNNISNYNASTNGIYQASTDTNHMMNSDGSPITNNSPYSACSLSPGSTPTTYQDGTNTGSVNNTWPYQGGSINGYGDSQLSSYNQSRSSTNSSGYGSGSSYSSLNGGTNIWGNVGSMSDSSSSAVNHTDHAMKVG